jgi:hypothetical protein
MAEETNLRNWGWGLPFEPIPLENETPEGYAARHHQWCSDRIKWLERAFTDSQTERHKLQDEAKELREKNAAYETVLSSRGKSGVAIYEPGTEVEITRLSVKGRIHQVSIGVGGIPLYEVVYPADGVWQRSWLHGDDLSVGRPLGHPSQLWGQIKR